jgi:glucose-1-phosphate adenylyltransferase
VNRVTVLILGGGQGKRLFPLTSYRSKPAVPIGGKYRLVDIPISNSINSGLQRIFVLTQFNSTSLHRHIHRTYPYEYFHQTSVELLAAEQTLANTDWFQGTADAVRKHLPHYHLEASDTVLILSGDHLYRMDYREILKFHEEKNADVTISTVPVLKKEVKHFGIMQIRANGHISAFREKPTADENVQSFIIPDAIRDAFHVKGKGDHYLASMGVYVFKAKVLADLLAGREADFGKEVIPKAIEKYNVYGYVFNGYWRDIGTIEGYYDASMDLTSPNPSFKFFEPNGVIFTRARFLPPCNIASAKLKNALLADGCILDEAEVEDSIIGVRAVVRKGSTVRGSVIMGSDYYELEKTRAHGIGIGKNCHLERCIIDKNVRIGNNVKILNSQKIQEKDGENYYIRDGIVIIPKDAHIPDGTEI